VIVALLIVAPALLRALELEWNIVPIGALALFAGARVRSKSLALAIPLSAMVLGDVFLGLKHHDMAFFTFHRLLPVVYGCYAFSVLMGVGLRLYWGRLDSRPQLPREARDDRRPSATTDLLKTRVIPIALGTVAGSVVFFLVTNFGVWCAYDTYPPTWSGLLQCYQAAIPYFRGTFTGDVVGSVILFGGDYVLQLDAAAARESTRI
jgi:hypothetical protein